MLTHMSDAQFCVFIMSALAAVAFLANWKWKFFPLGLPAPERASVYQLSPDSVPLHLDDGYQEYVKGTFLSRLKDPASGRKRERAALFWRERVGPAPMDVFAGASLEARLREMVKSSHCGIVFPKVAGSVGGIAGRSCHHKGKLILGFEMQFLATGSLLRNNCVDHELTHCIQDAIASTIAQESWGCLDVSIPKVESHALLYGGGISYYALLLLMLISFPWVCVFCFTKLFC